MSAEILVILWYYWSAAGLQPAARNTLGPDIVHRYIGADR